MLSWTVAHQKNIVPACTRTKMENYFAVASLGRREENRHVIASQRMQAKTYFAAPITKARKQSQIAPMWNKEDLKPWTRKYDVLYSVLTLHHWLKDLARHYIRTHCWGMKKETFTPGIFTLLCENHHQYTCDNLHLAACGWQTEYPLHSPQSIS